MKNLFILFFSLLLAASSAAQVKVVRPMVENQLNPISIDALTPRFSWQLAAGDKRGVMQTAYEIRVFKITPKGGKAAIWTTGRVHSDQSVYVPYKGAALTSGTRYIWQVRVWDNSGKASDWSEPAWWQMGLLKPADWEAKWITPGFTEDSVNRPSPLFRKTFHLTKKIRSAVAYVTAHGLYEAKINGHRVSDAYLTPGWTSYNKRLQYQAYDVTSLLKEGTNAAGAELGNGWYRGYVGYNPKPGLYGKDIAL